MAVFGYAPPERFDLLPEIVNGRKVTRTKSRAYKMAVWSGVTGIHWAYLGQRGRARLVFFLALWLPLLLAFFAGLVGIEQDGSLSPLLWLFAFWPILMWIYQAWKVANMAEDDPLFSGATTADFFPPQFWQYNWQWWSPENWGKRTDADEQRKAEAIAAAARIPADEAV